MFHIFELVDHPHMFGQSVMVLNEGLFEIHDIFVRGLLCAIDVDGPEVLIVGGFDEGELGDEGTAV